MATYFITTMQLNKLQISKPYQAAKLHIKSTEIAQSDWQELFNSPETLAWSESYRLKPEDQLIYMTHAQPKGYMLGEVANGTIY